jgi:hypothetical protein
VHAILSRLPAHDAGTSVQALPENGIYFSYENGEPDGRIVRVGTHRVDGRFRTRVRLHYGGNKNASVFRLHVGGALLLRDQPDDPRLSGWLTHMGPTFKDVESRVSQVLRETFTYRAVRVDSSLERLTLERGLIALLAQRPIAAPSPTWLGHHAAAEPIRRSGLWNTQHVDAQPLTAEQLARFELLVDNSRP